MRKIQRIAAAALAGILLTAGFPGAGREVHAEENREAAGNLILNPGFEEESGETVQLPAEWKERNTDPDASYVEKGEGYDGEYYLVHNGSKNYQVTTYQDLTGLEEGLYTLRAWVKTTGGQNYANMFINGYGGRELSYPLYRNKIDEWTQISITDIEITTGKCMLGFYSQSPAGNMLWVDNVELVKQTEPEKTPLRWDLSPENPIFQIIMWEDSGLNRECTIEKEWQAVDPALRANTVPVFGPLLKSGKFDGDAEVEWLERNMDYCEANGIKFMLQTATWATGSWGYIPDYKLAEYFEKYSCLIGLQQVEVTCGAGFPAEDEEYFIQNINVCAKYGGLFVYKDQTYNKVNNSYASLGENKRLLNKMRSNSENCVLMWKANGISQHYENTSYPLGYWLSGITSNWGVNAEAWLNVEQGYNTLGADAATRKSGGVEGVVFRTPEAQLGQMMIMCAANGATIYSYEDAWQAQSWQGTATPAYEMVLAPFQKKLIEDELIPTREEMLSKVKAAYHQSELYQETPELTEDYGTRLYNGLYGIRDYTVEDFDQSGVQFEWFPHTGRYLLLPILPYYATEEELAVFPSVIDHESFVSDYDNGGQKYEDYFNSLYPEEYTGSSWAQRMDDTWYLMNPSENHITESDFDLTLSGNNCASVSGTMDEHTFSYIKENEGELKIFADNLRVDKQVLDNQSRISQKVSVREDGVYDVSAWISSSDTSATLNVTVNGGPRKFANVKKGNDYQEYVISDIELHVGDEVCVYLTGSWNGWTNADDFALRKQGDSRNLLTNPGFEDGKDGWEFAYSSGTASNNPKSGTGHVWTDPGPTAFGWSDNVTEHKDEQFSFDRFYDEYYLDNYDIREMRETVYVLEDVNGGEPQLKVEGENYEYSTEWDSEEKTFTVTLSYNGYVDMTVTMTDEEPTDPVDPDQPTDPEEPGDPAGQDKPAGDPDAGADSGEDNGEAVPLTGDVLALSGAAAGIAVSLGGIVWGAADRRKRKRGRI